jgi:hypothetical protein
MRGLATLPVGKSIGRGRSNGIIELKEDPHNHLEILAVAAAGYVIGSQGVKWVRDRKAKQYRAESTAAAVAQMNDTLRVGNQLPDHEFHNLRGGTCKLSDLVEQGAVAAG